MKNWVEVEYITLVVLTIDSCVLIIGMYCAKSSSSFRIFRSYYILCYFGINQVYFNYVHNTYSGPVHSKLLKGLE